MFALATAFFLLIIQVDESLTHYGVFEKALLRALVAAAFFFLFFSTFFASTRTQILVAFTSGFIAWFLFLATIQLEFGDTPNTTIFRDIFHEPASSVFFSVVFAVFAAVCVWLFPSARSIVKRRLSPKVFMFFAEGRTKNFFLFVSVGLLISYPITVDSLCSNPTFGRFAFFVIASFCLLILVRDLSAFSGTQLPDFNRFEQWAGFLFVGALSLDVIYRSVNAFGVFPTESYLYNPLIALPGIFLLIVLGLGRRPYLIVFALVVYTIAANEAETMACSWGFAQWGEREAIPKPTALTSSIGLSLVALQAVMILRYRVHVGAFLLYGLLASLIISANQDSTVLTLLTVTAVFLILGITNFFIQLFLENAADISNAFKQLSGRKRVLFIARTFWLWFPAALLTLFAWTINTGIHNQAKSLFYTHAPLVVAEENQDLPIPERNLRIDVLYTLESNRRTTSGRFYWALEEANVYSEGALDALPEATAQFIEGQRPGPVDNSPCQNAVFSLGKSPFKLSFSLRTLCRGMISVVDQSIQRSFNKASANINAKVSEISTDASVSIYSVKSDIQDAGRAQIDVAYESVANTISLIFIILSALTLMALMYLVATLISGLNVVAGRVLFDVDSSTTSAKNTFSLATGSPKTISWRSDDKLALSDEKLGGHDQGWYVYRKASRRGQNTHFTPRPRFPTKCVLKRLFSGRYIFSYVDTRPSRLNNLSTDNEPRISMPGDTRLVAVDVPHDQPLVFRMSDLIAFSSNVKIKSIYTTHVAASILGLGRFYCIAYVGPTPPPPYADVETTDAASEKDAHSIGTIILRSEGQEIETLNTQSSPSSFLLWDQRATYSVAQDLSHVGVWLAPADLSSDQPGSTIWHERGPAQTNVLGNLFRLLRYVLLPF